MKKYLITFLLFFVFCSDTPVVDNISEAPTTTVSIEKNICSKLIMTGCILMILYQVLIHVGVNIRLLPTTGMTLPFLSYGGSSIVSTAILSGLILNLTKRKLD